LKIKFIVREIPVDPRIVAKMLSNREQIVNLIKSIPGVSEYKPIDDSILMKINYGKSRSAITCNLEAKLKYHKNGFTLEGLGDTCKFLLTILVGSKEPNTLLSIKTIYEGRNESTAKKYIDEIIDHIASYLAEEAGKVKEVMEAEKAQRFFWTEYILMKLTDKQKLAIKSELLRKSPLEDLGKPFGKLILYSNNYSCEKVLNKIRLGSLDNRSKYYIVCIDDDYRVKIRMLVENNVITGIAALIEGLWFLGEYAAKILVDNINKLNRVRIWVLRGEIGS